MGTAATCGALVWRGLDSAIDYQMLIGGPGFWDVNAGCGRVRVSLHRGRCAVFIHCDGDLGILWKAVAMPRVFDEPVAGVRCSESSRLRLPMSRHHDISNGSG
jgi:hypothetical protein